MNRTKHKNPIGMGGLFPILFAVLVLVSLLGMYVMIEQRMSDTRHRMNSMRSEMAMIETSMLSLRAQQDAMLTRESLRQQLAGVQAELVPIASQSIIVIQEGATGSGVAMENRVIPNGDERMVPR